MRILAAALALVLSIATASAQSTPDKIIGSAFPNSNTNGGDKWAPYVDHWRLLFAAKQDTLTLGSGGQCLQTNPGATGLTWGACGTGGGGGGVTSLTFYCGATTSGGTGALSLQSFAAPATRSNSTDTPTTADCGNLITYTYNGTVTVSSFPAASTTGARWGATYCTGSTTTVNFATLGGNFQASGSSTITLAPKSCMTVISDASNYATIIGAIGGTTANGAQPAQLCGGVGGTTCTNPIMHLDSTEGYSGSAAFTNTTGTEFCEVGRLGRASTISAINTWALANFGSAVNYQFTIRTADPTTGLPNTAANAVVAYTVATNTLPTAGAPVAVTANISYPGTGNSGSLAPGTYFTCINVSANPSTGYFNQASAFGATNNTSTVSYLIGFATVAAAYTVTSVYGVNCTATWNNPAASISSCTLTNNANKTPHFTWTLLSQP